MTGLPGLRAHRASWLLFAAASLAVSACRRASPEPGTVPNQEGRFALTVRNNYRLDVNVFVLQSGQPTRVGQVTAAMVYTFDLPDRMLSQGRLIRLRVDPVGSTRTLTSETVRVGVGQRLEWTIESDLAKSHLAVY